MTEQEFKNVQDIVNVNGRPWEFALTPNEYEALPEEAKVFTKEVENGYILRVEVQQCRV